MILFPLEYIHIHHIHARLYVKRKFSVQNYVVQTCIADIPEHEEKYDGIVLFCTIYLKFFFRDKILLLFFR
jgi:hypothetical protein